MPLALPQLSAPSTTERQLVQAVRRGEDRAFEELFSRYRRRISSYVYGLVGDHGRAEDITQEVFIAALRRLRETESPIAFKPWIYEIARNACIDEFRRTRRASLVSLEDAPDARCTQVPPVPDVTSPEARWERKQSLGDLCGAFSGLSDNHHRILVLRELEGLSYREIAERMGMSRPVVESTLFRARRRLSQEYDELASGQRCRDVRSALEALDDRPASALGVRERRRIADHLGHCHSCLQIARTAGVDEATLREPRVARRVAALTPLGWPALRRLGLRWWSRHAGNAGGCAVPATPTLADAAGPAAAIGRAVTAAAALLIAVGSVPGAGGHRHHSVPSTRDPAAPAAAARRGAASHPPVRPARVPAAAHPARHPHVRAAHLAAPLRTATGTRVREVAAGSSRPHGSVPPPAPRPAAPVLRAPSVPSTPPVSVPTGTLTGAAAQAVSAGGQLLSTATNTVGGIAQGAVGTLTTNGPATVLAGAGSAVPQTTNLAGSVLAGATRSAGAAVTQTTGLAGSVLAGTTGTAAGAVSSAGQGARQLLSRVAAGAVPGLPLP